MRRTPGRAQNEEREGAEQRRLRLEAAAAAADGAPAVSLDAQVRACRARPRALFNSAWPHVDMQVYGS